MVILEILMDICVCVMKSYIDLCKRLSNWSINTKVIGDFKPQIEECALKRCICNSEHYMVRLEILMDICACGMTYGAEW